MGRPSKFTAALAHEICRLMGEEGQSLRQICRTPGMPAKETIRRWIETKPGFQAQYTRAREELLEFWADQITAIADDGEADVVMRVNERGEEYTQVDQEHINRSRLRVDARKWLMSKLAPKKYGDKITQEVTGADGAPLVPVLNVTISGPKPEST